MFKLMGKNIMTILRSNYLLNWTYSGNILKGRVEFRLNPHVVTVCIFAILASYILDVRKFEEQIAKCV